ncbi:MAG: Gfo/Idh/MocA family oxidoreductase [Chloroflexota bacterium]
MSKIYRGALIGCGYASRFQLIAWARIEEAKIVAVSSRTREKAERRAAEFGVPAVYADYRKMLDAEALDFVDIATPPAPHLEMVSEAARRGLPILCQKPIAASLAELQEMIRVCHQAGVTFMVNENCRFQPWFRKMKTLLDAGAIGQPYYANFTSRARATLPIADFGVRPWFAEMPRFVNYELGVHYLDTLRYLFGEAESVYAQMRRVSQYIEGEDLTTLMLKMGEVTAVVDMSWVSIPIWEDIGEKKVSWGECRIEGTEGTLHLDTGGLLRLITDEGEKRFPFPPNSEVLGYQGAQQHFIDCLRSGEESETSGSETVKTMELVFGAYDSAEHDRIYRVGNDLERLE